MEKHSFVERLTDLEIKQFAIDYLKKFDNKQFGNLKAKQIWLDREKFRLIMHINNPYEVRFILSDFDAVMPYGGNGAVDKDVKKDWLVYLTKKFPKEYIEKYYKLKQKMLKAEYDKKIQKLNKEIKGIVDEAEASQEQVAAK